MNPFLNFAVCALFGFLGVHKFLQKKTFMGVLYFCTCGLFGIGWFLDSVKAFAVLVTSGGAFGLAVRDSFPALFNVCSTLVGGGASVRRLRPSDPLPIVRSNVMLSNGEVCHYNAAAAILTTKNVTVGYTGESAGISFRLTRRLTLRSGKMGGATG